MKELVELYRSWAGVAPERVELLPLSGSARKYYRMGPAEAGSAAAAAGFEVAAAGSAGGSSAGCAGGRTVIGCIGTSLAENRAFVAVDEAMRRAGVAAPEVFAVAADGMRYLQEDLGGDQLFELLGPAIATGEYGPREIGWLRDVMRALPGIQLGTGREMAAGPGWDVCFPDREFNRRMVTFDLNYFKYDFLKFTGLEFDEIRLQDDFDRLIDDSLVFSGDTFMYRDFQARNIMIRDGKPCFIDFQGGRRGPLQYDLASFLWNAGTHFSASLRAELEAEYLAALRELVDFDEEEFRLRYRLMTLVRLLQEMGAYGFRGIYERKQIFLDCLPTVLSSLKELVAEPYERYPYLSDLLLRLSQWDYTAVL